MKIGQQIKEYRSKADISQSEFARRVGYTRQYIKELEDGIECMLPIEKIEAIAEELGISLKEALKGVSCKQEYKGKTYYKVYLDEGQLGKVK